MWVKEQQVGSQFDPRVNRRTLVAATASGSLASLAGLRGASAGPDRVGTRQPMAQAANLPTPREQTLVIEADPTNIWDSFNPFIPNGEAGGFGIATISRELLFYTNALTGEIKPWLGLDYAYNDDFTQCTLTLNPNATWSDGEPFTADDVVFSQTLLLENPTLNGAAAAIRDIKVVSATDAHTVVWDLTAANPRFHYRFQSFFGDQIKIVPKHLWEGQDAGTFKFNPPVTTGPYTLVEASASKLHYLWQKNPDYWNIEEFNPAPEYVLIRQMGEVDASVQEFLAGNVDHSARLRADYLNQHMIEAQYDKTSRFDFPDPCPRGFHFNVDSPSGLFKTPEGRWAISHLIDRETAASTIWQPSTRTATYPWADYESWKAWAPDEVMGRFDLTLNVDKANELLDQLGATERDGDTRVMDGKPLRLTVISPRVTTDPEFQIAVAFATTAKDAGIDVEVKSLPGSAYGDAFSSGQFDIACAWICGMQFDPNQLYVGYHSRNYVPAGEAANAGNAVRLQSAELDDLIDQLAAVDPGAEASRPLFDQALEVFIRELPSAPIIQTPYPLLFNTAYWTGWPTPENPAEMPADWLSTFVPVLGLLQPAEK
jgi:peptide/nickel transport system substrate-binding protein